VTVLDGDRPGILIALHGLTGSREQALALLAGVHRPGFGVLAPDLRAHGETALVGPPEAFTPAGVAEDVAELVHALGLASRHLCVLGISLGATVALELIRAGMLDVDGAIFVRPAHFSGPPPHLEVNRQIAAYLRDDPFTALGRLLANDRYRDVAQVSASAAASLRAKVTGPGAPDRVMRLEAGSGWSAFTPGERLTTSVPALVLAMARDPLHPLDVAEAWHHRIRGSSLVVVPSRDEDPEASAAAARRAIAGFLAARAAEWD
jgi:pimeloyl-ACP methyl ester carboxylesterase